MLHLFLKPAHLSVATCYIFFWEILRLFLKGAMSFWKRCYVFSSRQEVLMYMGLGWRCHNLFFAITKIIIYYWFFHLFNLYIILFIKGCYFNIIRWPFNRQIVWPGKYQIHSLYSYRILKYWFSAMVS